MRKQADGKVRRSREEWEQIFERFRSSGQTGAAFCRKNKLPKSSFEKWSDKIGRGSKSRGLTPALIEWPAPVELEAPIPSSSSGPAAGEFEILLPGHVVLHWKP